MYVKSLVSLAVLRLSWFFSPWIDYDDTRQLITYSFIQSRICSRSFLKKKKKKKKIYSRSSEGAIFPEIISRASHFYFFTHFFLDFTSHLKSDLLT